MPSHMRHQIVSHQAFQWRPVLGRHGFDDCVLERVMAHLTTFMVQFLQGVKEKVVSLLMRLHPKRMWELLKKLDVVLIEVDRHLGDIMPDRHFIEGLEMVRTESGEGLLLEGTTVGKVRERGC